jgi:hypothetical protein
MRMYGMTVHVRISPIILRRRRGRWVKDGVIASSTGTLKHTFENFDIVVLWDVRRSGWELDTGEEGLGRGAGLEVS